MYCKICGAEIEEGKGFCSSCGAAVITRDSGTTVITETKKKKPTVKIIICIAVALVVVVGAVLIFSMVSKPTSKNLSTSKSGYSSYNAVLKVCCDAINQRNKELLDSVVYKGFGKQWNDMVVYRIVDEYYDRQEDGVNYKEITTDAFDYKEIATENDDQFEEIKQELFHNIGFTVDLKGVCKLVADTELHQTAPFDDFTADLSFILVRIGNSWYAYSLHLL